MRPIPTTAATCRALLRSRKGATAIEYGLIAALVVLVMLVGFQRFASEALEIWNMVANRVVTATS